MIPTLRQYLVRVGCKLNLKPGVGETSESLLSYSTMYRCLKLNGIQNFELTLPDQAELLTHLLQ